MKTNRLKIGEFSRLCRVTVRTLRHYEEIDLLVPEIVASHRTTIPSFDDLGRLCYEVIGPEMARLGCECPEPGYCYTIEHGGYKPKDIDIEYCEKVTAKGKDSAIIKFKDVPVVPTAVCMKVYGPYDRLYQNFNLAATPFLLVTKTRPNVTKNLSM